MYSNRVVCFIDILGFGELIKSLETDSELHQKLHGALKRIKSYKASSLEKNTAQSDLEVSVFSDSIVISSEEDGYHGVVWSSLHLQCDLLSLGILTRGGMSLGKTIHEDDILYGEGMLKSYNLESRAAVYPRIIIDQSILELTNEGYQRVFFSKDIDGLWHLDPFSIGIQPGGMAALVEDGWDPYEVSLNDLKKKINGALSSLTDENQMAKWAWLKSKLDLAVIEYQHYGQPRYWHYFEMSHKKNA